MKSRDALNLLNKIDTEVINLTSLGSTDPKVISYFAKYLAVFICGIYESAIETILTEKFRRARSAYLMKYLLSDIKRLIRNPKFHKICDLLDRFNPSWSKRLKKGVANECCVAIDNLVNVKNELAHTGTTQITWGDVRKYYKDSRLVVEKIDQILL